MTEPAAALPVPTLAHRAEYALLRGTLGALGALPWDVASALGARLGRLGYRPFGIRRKVVEQQIATSLPELSMREVRSVARGAYESLGRTTVEAALLPDLPRERVLELVETTERWDLIEQAMAGGRGAIIITGHVGNWELAGAYVAARGIPLEAIARGQGNPLFDRYLTETRTRAGMAVVHDRDAVRRTPRALRENRAVAFLADQGVLGLASTWVPFFGRPAKTPRGPAVFALRLRPAVLFAASLRKPNGRYHLGFQEVPVVETGDRERDVDAIVAAYTGILEQWVRRAPEQYFWHHRRWKHQQPGSAPGAGEP
jgi:KDO2-lipid IV(A) lauroyltransferase